MKNVKQEKQIQIQVISFIFDHLQLLWHTANYRKYWESKRPTTRYPTTRREKSDIKKTCRNQMKPKNFSMKFFGLDDF